MPFRVGIQVNTTQKHFEWSEIRDLAMAAEDLELDSIWTEDHLFYRAKDDPVGPWDAWTILGGLSEVTRRVRIGTLVSPLGLRHPSHLMKMAETVDEMSGGRLVLGLGLGWAEEEHKAAGATIENRLDRFRETLDLMITGFENGYVDYHGHHVTAEGFHLLPRGPRQRPELMIGSTGPLALKAALPFVDGWNWDGFTNRPDRFSTASSMVDQTCLEIGRDPSSVYRSAHLIVRLDGAEGLPLDPLPNDMPIIVGPANQIAESLDVFQQAGASEVTLLLDPPKPAALQTLAQAKQLLGH